MERKNIWNLYSDEQISELKEINDKYKLAWMPERQSGSA